MKKIEIIYNGIIKENPIFGLVLGLCPTLAVTTSVKNALGMGLAASFVLVCSNFIISLFRRFIPSEIRIPSFIVIIATFVTIVQLIIKAYSPELDRNLGIFIPLIVVNCIILGRAEAFASRNNVIDSIIDGLSMGIGFTLSLMIISFLRELIGTGKVWGMVIYQGYQPAWIMIMAPGAFIIMGLIMAFISSLKKER